MNCIYVYLEITYCLYVTYTNKLHFWGTDLKPDTQILFFVHFIYVNLKMSSLRHPVITHLTLVGFLSFMNCIYVSSNLRYSLIAMLTLIESSTLMHCIKIISELSWFVVLQSQWGHMWDLKMIPFVFAMQSGLCLVEAVLSSITQSLSHLFPLEALSLTPVFWNSYSYAIIKFLLLSRSWYSFKSLETSDEVVAL